LLEEESQLDEPESLPEPSPTLAILDPEPPKKEETPILDFLLEFEDELFDEYGNTLNYSAGPSVLITFQNWNSWSQICKTFRPF
jgi:hypothetical protein